MNFQEAQKIIMRVTYKPDYYTVLEEWKPDVWRMWGVFDVLDCVSKEPVQLESRVWFVTPDFSEEDLVGTIFLMYQQIEQHEMLEWFKVDGYSITNPHLTISARKGAVRASFDAETLAAMDLTEVQ